MMKRMMNGTFYLNNDGSRWVHLIKGEKEKIILSTKAGKKIERTAIFYESFGNFAVACISYKGKKIKVFPDTLLED